MRACTQVESTGDANPHLAGDSVELFLPALRERLVWPHRYGGLALGAEAFLGPRSNRKPFSRKKTARGLGLSEPPPVWCAACQLGPSLERNIDRNSSLSQDDWTNEECEWHTQRPAPVSGLVHRSAHKVAAV